LQGEARPLAVVAEDVHVALRRGRHLLLLGDGEDGLAQVAVLRRHLEAHLLGGAQHPPLVLVGQLAVPAFEKHPHVAHRLGVLVRRAEALDARAEATLDVVFEAGARELAVDLDVAGAQLEGAVDEIDGTAREARGQERPEVERAVALDAARDHHAREGLVDRQFQVRVLLVILERDVVARLVLLDEVRLKHQRLDLRVRDDELKVGDAADELAGLRVVPAPRLEVGADAVAQILRLADVDDLARVVLVQVDAGRSRQGGELFL
jgi:hypothetical protein